MKLLRELDKDVEIRLKKAIFAGRLATDDELANSFIEAPIKFQDEFNEFLLFHIKCLSHIPEELSQHFYYHNNIFRGSTRSPNNIQKIKSNLIPNYDRLSPNHRREKLQQTLEGKLVLFSLYCSGTTMYLDIIKIESVDLKTSYHLLPGPTLRLDEKRRDFEERMIAERPIVLAHYPNIFQDPEFIYYDNVLYSNIKLKPSENPTTYYVRNPEEVRCLKVSHTFFEHIESRYDDSAFFIPEDIVDSMKEEMEKEGEYLLEAMTRKDESPRQETKPERPEPETVKPAKAAVAAVEPVADGLERDGEVQFLERLEENAKLRGLYYDPADLYNFHTSVKTNLLTIVGGMSGTGKSQLALLYGETLGLTFGKQLRLIPVSPSYHEPSDILGYLNPATGVYNESETGLVSLLLEAEQNPDQLFMVIFDEMNLSQVEHWFSPFISLLELEQDKRRLTLFNQGSYCINQYKAQVNILDNIIFVGTVNFDETTKSFSDRLLDRANVITPRKLTFKEVRDLQTNTADRYIVKLDIDRKMFREAWLKSKSGELENLTDAEIQLFDNLHEELQKTDSQQGISFRVVRAIAHYLENIPAAVGGNNAIQRSTALDFQLKQRVLSKLSGLESTIGSLVGTYEGEEYQEGRIALLLQSPEAQQISNFKWSIEELKKKAKELVIHGFAR